MSPRRKRKSRRQGRSHIPRPFVSATFAMTVDGKITTRDFAPVDFTSREDKQHLFRQRALADAVLIGHTTLERDNVRLGVSEDLRQERIKRGQSPAPLRVIVSNEGNIGSELKIFQWQLSRILIFSTKRMPQTTQAALSDKAILHLTQDAVVDLEEMLRVLAKRLQSPTRRLRRRANSLSLNARTWIDRRAQPDNCAVFVWRSRRANAHRSRVGISGGKRAMCHEGYARRR